MKRANAIARLLCKEILKASLQHVTIDTGYLMGPIRIQMTVSLYPEGSGMEPGQGQLERGSGI